MATILIVDDQPQFRRVLRLALGTRGYAVHEAEGGAAVMDLVRTQHPDLILVDWVMPDIDGIRVCRAIRAMSDVPIIMVTSREGGRAEAMAAGADDYVTKPFAVDDLLGRIESVLTR